MDMGNIGKMAIAALVIMIFIYAYKTVLKNYNVPVLSKIAEEV